MAELDAYVREEKRRAEAANRRRYAGEGVYLHNALTSLQNAVGGKAEKAVVDDGSGSGGPVLEACMAVAKVNGMECTAPRLIREGASFREAVDNIAAASHFRTRAVLLDDKWHKSNSGNLVATLAETGEPVALLQKSPRRYELYNPATGKRVKVTKKIADSVYPSAVMLYRNLPMNSLSGMDVIRFVLKGTSIADWLCVILVGVGGGLLGMITPEVTGRVFDTVIPDGDRNMLAQIAFLLTAVSLTTFTFELTRSFALQRLSGAMERDLQSAVWDRLLSLPVGFFKQYPAGELAQRAMSISQIEKILSGMVINTVFTTVFSVFYLITMFTKGAGLAWVGLAIVVVMLAVTLGFGFAQTKFEGEQLKVDNKISGKMFGWLSGLAKIKMSGSEKRTFHNWANLYRESREITFKKEGLGNWSAVWNSVVTLISSGVIYFAMYKMKDATLGMGAFIAFNAAFGSLMQNCVQLAGAVMSMNIIGPLYDMAKPIFEAQPEYDDQKMEAPKLAGDIELSRVNFSYNADGPQVLHDVSLRVRSGEHVALVGPSGSGKSTLFRILLAFEQPDSGEIYFDGYSLSQLDIRSVRKQLGVVLQSGQLLAGSIMENIAGSNPDITQDDAMQAIIDAGMEEDLKQMPMGLHTVISEGSGTISGGQRQRLLIARALAGKPQILFFDEATSALDNKTQKIVSDSVNKLKTTRITIAHRLSTIQECDRIIVLEAGRITEEGSYDELMKLGGTFAEMAKRQLA